MTLPSIFSKEVTATGKSKRGSDEQRAAGDLQERTAVELESGI